MLSADDAVHAVAYDAVIISVGTSAPTPTPTTTPAPTPRPTPITSATPLPVSLGNVSTRLQVGTGNNVLIGGFIVAGTGAKRVIIRALGPSLTPKGVSNALNDPILELHNSRGNLIFSNDNWKDTQEQWIRDSLIPPTNDRESAIVARSCSWPLHRHRSRKKQHHRCCSG